MNLGLDGRSVVVTGASRGIGAAAAEHFAREGCSVVAVARSALGLDRCRQVISERTGRTVQTHVADLARPEGISSVVDRWGHADVLVNNAGAIPGGKLAEVDDATWRNAWDLKVFGYVNLTRAFLAAMEQRGSGVIVNVIGVTASTRDPSYICGVTANAALTALTLSVGSDSPRRGVRVVGVSPGPVATDRLRELEATTDAARAPRPFGRAASPDEIAAAITFLASPLSAYTSGVVLSVDGGLSGRASS